MAAGGFFLGIGLVWSKDRFSIWLQDSEDISMTATAPILGQLPMLPQELNSPNLRAQGVLLRPHDEAAKAVEHIRAELENRLIPEMRKTILITSPTSFQGKSMLASNLAISMARCGLRVALIDTNFRRPAINEIFGVDDLIGLSDAIEGKITIGQALRVTGLSGLEVMPAGYSNTAGAELLNRPQFAEVLNQLSKRFDRVVIDGDCARMDQCRILSSFCNATIMLVYSQGGRRNELVRAVDGLRAAGANVMGIVLNDLPRFRASARMKGQPLSASKSIHPEEAENPCGRALETSQQFGQLTDEIIDFGKLASDL
jgi:capsular exopolysaccharide synthesis family protein